MIYIIYRDEKRTTAERLPDRRGKHGEDLCLGLCRTWEQMAGTKVDRKAAEESPKNAKSRDDLYF